MVTIKNEVPESMQAWRIHGDDPEKKIILERTLNGMHLHYRHVIQLRFFEGMTFSLIASSLGISYSQARALYGAAVLELKKRLRRAGIDKP